MKEIHFILYFLLFCSKVLISQNVNIPDPVFKDYILGVPGIDLNSDGEIQLTEANNFSAGLDISNLAITDLTGLEAFTNITSFNCFNVGLTALDVSSNQSLKTLYCNNNQLISLNISSLSNLTILQCNHNQLSGLDVSNNVLLRELYCIDNEIGSLNLSMLLDIRVLYCAENNIVSINLPNGSSAPGLNRLRCEHNSITALDLSAYPILDYLDCSNNVLTELDISNGKNSKFLHFNASNNNLNCIEVDNVSWSNTNWIDLVDQGTGFSTNCP